MSAPTMEAVQSRLLLAALPAIVASFLVLLVLPVPHALVLAQAAYVAAALLLALAVRRARWFDRPMAAWATLLVAVLLCATPLLSMESRPARWISAIGAGLYCAPIVLPAVLLSTALRGGEPRTHRWSAYALLLVLACALALQPDASQSLALAVALAAIVWHNESRWPVRVAVLLPASVLAWAAATRPDPLQPVDHVELVFATTWHASTLAGICVALAAVAWLVLLWRAITRIHPAAVAIPLYYAVLYACSIAGLTPAPLIGYGVAPLLGYGLLVGLASVAARASSHAGPPA